MTKYTIVKEDGNEQIVLVKNTKPADAKALLVAFKLMDKNDEIKEGWENETEMQESDGILSVDGRKDI